MTRPRGTTAGSVVDEQRRAVERLKETLFGTDPFVRSRYILDYHKEFRSFRRRIRRADLFAACRRADVVLVGDYHALPSCQSFAAELIEDLAARGERVLLFLEMVFGRDQKTLDRFQAGEIDEAEFRRAIRYEREWGYPWHGYGRLLEAAREARVPVIAADAPPRGGLRLIRRRDRHAAFRITDRLLDEPGAKAVVLFGESHVARGHLPHDVRLQIARARARLRSIVVVQNVEEMYWSMARAPGAVAEAVKIDSDRYAVFNASPLAKYEAYRQTLMEWSRQRDEAPDFLPSIHHFVELIASHLGIDPYRARPAPAAALRVPLVDLYPAVATRRERRNGPRQGARGGRDRRSARRGVIYRQAPNRIDVYSFSIEAAAEASAQFLLSALAGKAGRPEGAPAGVPIVATGRGTAAAAQARPKRALRAGNVLQRAFVSFAVCYLDPCLPFVAFGSKEDGAVAERAQRALRGLADELLDGAGARGRAGRRGASARAGSGRRSQVEDEKAGWALGRAVYGRMRRRPKALAKRWLLNVASRSAGGAGAKELGKLVIEGLGLAAWGRGKKARGGTP